MIWPSNSLSARTCKLRILIVADGGIHFSNFVSGFGLSEFLNAIRESVRPWEDLSITTALRGEEDLDHCTQKLGFKFDTSTFNIKLYDELWLFGHSNEDDNPATFLEQSELKAIYAFMNDGGGVFATGDHKSLGYALCGEIPRVKSMRKWQFKSAPTGMKAPGRDDATRLDTLREGFDPGFQITDQSDSVPQEIRPKFFANLGGVGAHPHPLLADRDFVITVLPDHQHEGECAIPEDLTQSYQFDGGEPFDEYPKLPRSDQRLAPDVVAISTSAGGYLRGDLVIHVPPVEPRCFNIIVAYDGHLIERVKDKGKNRLGRVVVDSTFHHFLDINLSGKGSSDPNKKGFYDANGKPTKDYEAFKKYYRNILTWLRPADGRFEYYVDLLMHLRYTGDLMEEFSDSPTFDVEEILYAGTVTRKAIAEWYSTSEAIACAVALLEVLDPELGLKIEKLLNPWLPEALYPPQLAILLNSEVLLRSILGLAMLGISEHLPGDILQAQRRLEESEKLSEDVFNLVAEKSQTKLGHFLEAIRRLNVENETEIQP
jgi:hypothetical protein